jgi:hypothetical protein
VALASGTRANPLNVPVPIRLNVTTIVVSFDRFCNRRSACAAPVAAPRRPGRGRSAPRRGRDVDDGGRERDGGGLARVERAGQPRARQEVTLR